MKRDEFDIGEVRPVGLEVGFFELETVEAALGVGFGGGHIRGDVEVTGSGDARPRAALVTREELAEVPLAVLHGVEGHSPAAVVADLPAGELDAGAEDGAFILISADRQRGLVRASVFGGECQRLVELVNAAAEMDGDGLVFDATRCFQGAGGRGERLFERAAACVVAAGSDEKIGSLRGG